MPKLLEATPRLSVRLYKTISRETVDGQSAVSARYRGKEEYIDLTPFLNDGSSVRVSKSVREPAGAFSLTFADRPHGSALGAFAPMSETALESVYGLIEPMDMIEIRMWDGVGPWTSGKDYPIKMRGIVSDVERVEAMGQGGQPQRQVMVAGQDYGKFWQMFQVLYLPAYADKQALLTNFGLWEMFGIKAAGVLKSGEWVQTMVDKVLNPFIDKFLPANSPLPRKLKTDILVKHGVVNDSYQNMQGSIYDILRFHGDVGTWNELYVEDREDGVYVVYRPVPALKLTADKGAKSRKIQDDAPEPTVVEVPGERIRTLSCGRSDNAVANFFWVNNARFDLIDDMQRKLASIPKDDGKVSIKDYPNAAVKYYATRPMYADTQQGDDAVVNMSSGQDKAAQDERSKQMMSWIEKRLAILRETNKDNVVLERGSATIKGGPMRAAGGEAMKAGDYAMFKRGRVSWMAYVTRVDDEFAPFRSYLTSLSFERGEGFVERSKMEGGASSPWLAEQASGGAL